VTTERKPAVSSGDSARSSRLNTNSLQFPSEQTSFLDNGHRPCPTSPFHIPNFLSFGEEKSPQSYKYFNNVLRERLFSVNKPNEV
jgi:hypothetical protein